MAFGPREVLSTLSISSELTFQPSESRRLLGPTNRQLGKADSAPPTLSELAWGPLNQEIAKGERGGDLEPGFRELREHLRFR